MVKKQWKDYWALAAFLAVRSVSATGLACILFFGRPLGRRIAYNLYFSVYWVSFALESILALLIVYGLFRLAMEPLKGLQTLGMLIFKWAAGISIAVALGSSFNPTVSGAHTAGVWEYIVFALSQLQRTQSILTLCLLLFVCFAIRPMGLSYSSRIFGVGLGLGIMSTNDLVQSAWLAYHRIVMDVTYNKINGVVICLILAIWTAYFVMPEPKRRMIVLPTTSPFLRWNQISAALGDNPGFVAVGGVPPEMFASAEIEVMRRASLKMKQATVTEFPMSVISEERLSSSRAI